jgi:hypothetical protein
LVDLALDGLRRLGLLIAALGVAFIIMVLVTLPLLALAWWLLLWASRQ